MKILLAQLELTNQYSLNLPPRQNLQNDRIEQALRLATNINAQIDLNEDNIK